MSILLRTLNQTDLKSGLKCIRNFFAFQRNNISFFKQKNNQNSQRFYSKTEASESENTINYLNKKQAENKLKNILVYSCYSSGSIRVNFLGLLGGFILLGASYNTWYLFSSVKFRSRKLENESGFFAAVLKLIGSEFFKLALCSSVAFIGVTTIIVTMFFTSRSVNKMYLLKGGQSIGIVTDGLFGREFKYVLDLDATSFSSTRKMRNSQVSFKNKNHYFYFLMNNIEGEYQEKILFDNVICVKRY